MKLHVLSDIHTEFAEFSPPETGADAVVLAGDIGVGLSGIQWAARTFPNNPVIYVPGNHEYYDQDLALLDELVNQSAPNIHVLNDAAITINGVRFLGSTLWTDFKFRGENEAWFDRNRAKHTIEDFSSIRSGGRAFTPEVSVELHNNSRDWLESELNVHFEGPTVVVTHHLPAAMSVAKQYANNPLNAAFASRLEDIIEQHQPKLWIHGHTHVPCDYEIFDTRVVCNPRGYPRETDGRDFDPGLVVDVPGAV
tara:strand:- start:1173 stop:1928 length:756 start_codon:yes stop_codon:yes gene_type:complete